MADVLIALTRVTVPEIVRLSLNVRIVRALTTSVCVTRNRSIPQGDSDQPSTVNAQGTLLVGTESRIALQNAQALIKSFVTAKVASNYGLEIVRKEWVTINTFE